MTLVLGVDTETTGLPARGEVITSPSYPYLVEMAAILFDTDTEREVAMFSFIIRPDGWTIPSAASEIHGITQEMATARGVPTAVAIAAYTNLRAVSDEIIGHNVEFDLGMIAAQIHRLGRVPAHPGPGAVACTVALGTPICRIPATERMVAAGYGDQFKRPNLSELHQYLFGEPFDGAHSALADVRASLRCLFEIRRRAA